MLRFLLLLLAAFSLHACGAPSDDPAVETGTAQVASPVWQTIETTNQPSARHEAAFVAVDGKGYLLGGRGIKPVDIYDPTTRTWSQGDSSPVEIHHFQPVVIGRDIYLVGAMTGGYPGEDPLPNVYVYSTESNTWRKGSEIPEGRRRGGAGAALHAGKIYLSAGIIDGHRGGHVPWLDVYDPATDTWTELADAPRPRDHFQAVAHAGKLYNLAGRTTVAATNPFANCIGEVDVYDFGTNTWSTLPDTLPTPRAGNAAYLHGDDIWVLGGESTAHQVAHDDVEALATQTGTFRALPPLNVPRHGTGAALLGGRLTMASGCGNRGGSPELSDVIARDF